MAKSLDYDYYIAHKDKIDNMIEEQTNGEAKAYICENLIVFFVKKDCCVFCEHCIDIVWDSHGPYMCTCELRKDYPCDNFVELSEKQDPQYYVKTTSELPEAERIGEFYFLKKERKDK